MIWKPAAPGNYAVGRKSKISRITFHHIVGDAAGAIARFQTPGEQVSATYVIGSDGTVYQCVKEEDTPFTDANADSNARAITIEHAGPPYAEPMYQASIKLVAGLIQKYGITDFKKHREVSQTPTACPGNLNVERIVKQAKEMQMPPIDRETFMRDFWSAFKLDQGPNGRQPTEKEVNDALGRDYVKYYRHWIKTDPIQTLLTKAAFYDQDVDTAAGQFKRVDGPVYRKEK